MAGALHRLAVYPWHPDQLLVTHHYRPVNHLPVTEADNVVISTITCHILFTPNPARVLMEYLETSLQVIQGDVKLHTLGLMVRCRLQLIF